MSCPDCYKGSILEGEPVGTFTSIDGAYMSAGSNKESERAVILLTDIFGLPLKNSKLIADSLAKRLECDVWVPDQFAGNPPFAVEKLQNKMPERAGEDFGLFAKIKFFLTVLPTLPKLLKSRPATVDARMKSFFDKLKAEKPHYKRIGAVGHCFGGSTAVRLGGTDYVHSIVVCHPGGFSDEELKAIKVPCSWTLMVLWRMADDFTFPPPKREKAEAEFAKRKDHQYEFKVYKGTAHGFACRPNMTYPDVKEGFEGAMEQIVAWFDKTLGSVPAGTKAAPPPVAETAPKSEATEAAAAAVPVASA
ncbi:hypothetical protein V5O48_010140 [Marasmius crinis-equi]|uniref:Dienelactone hydrolase domain-containing protein n=1 Tax=Marasmius crinis-equi TaxID=585013 RepID=A0ABR3F985_9AGAR